MKLIRKAISVSTAAIMAASACAVNMATIGTADAAGSKAAIELVNDMGLGWNLGNTFDAWSTDYKNGNCPADRYETLWGNTQTTQEIISELHKYGINSVRIPVTFYKCTDPSTFTISESYLARLKEVVDYCMNEGMYAIIDMHWDWVDPSNNAGLWLNNGLDAEAQFKSMWTQIANYFKSYDNHVVFQDMNEVWWNDKYTSSKSYDVLNTLNQDFVDAVRATGGNNANRLLLLAGANADLTNTLNSMYKLPEDDMIAVDIHYYTPPTFCVMKQNENWGGVTPKTTWGTAAEKAAVATDLNKLKSRFVDNNVPVIIGEYGVLTNEGKDQSSIEAFVETVAGTAYSMDGIASFLWDDSDSGGHEYFSRKNLKWWDEKIGDIFSDISKTGYKAPTIDWVETEITEENGKQMFQIGNSTRVKLVFETEYKDYLSSFGTGGSMSYWDTVSNSNKQNAISFSASWNEMENELLANELGPEDEEGNQAVVTTGYLNIPGDVAPANAYIDLYWAGYWDGAAAKWVSLTSDDVKLVKVFIDGVVDAPVEDPTQEPTTETPTEPPTDAPTDAPSNASYGDANEDDAVNLNDAVAILQYMALKSKYPLTDQGLINADIVDPGTSGVNGSDALAIQMIDATLVDLEAFPMTSEELSAYKK